MPIPWTSKHATSEEPPSHVKAVRDEFNEHIADRTDKECDFCGPSGSIWKWRHNGGSECWLEMDGIGPWTEVATQPSE
jgi:hypothetical protein